MVWKPRMAVREIIAAVLVMLAPAVYWIFSETSLGVPYQTAAGHALLLITLPVGLVLIWLIERRPPTGERPPTSVWARLLLGAAAGLLLATALAIINGRSAGDSRELSGTSLGTSLESGAVAGHAVIRLEDGRTIHLLNAFCGVSGSPVTVTHAKGLLGLDRLLRCNLPQMRPPQAGLPETEPK
ncbi:MAG: hypothetical protein EPO02_03230 [Nitrospirae bacterium]|nr:MAG: hypothetical protein EPO02_03230 [Nitrospirota bacterium]